MLNGKVCIKRQGHLELYLFKGAGTLRGGVWAGSFPLEASLSGRMPEVSSCFQPGVSILILMEI